LLLPTIFQKLNEKTLYLFGAVNVFTIFTTWAFYPESGRRTLEQIDMLFASDSVFAWNNEKDFQRLQAEHAELNHATAVDRRDTLVEAGAPEADKAEKVTVEHA
jgi:hypothetical protein